MGARSSGREAALQMLFAREVSGATVAQVIASYWRELPGDVEGREFADELVRAVVAATDDIDQSIRAASRHWRLERMARVDRNILRLGVYELRSAPDVPRAVIIDEAVELAKRFGSEGSSVFVNGVLDRIADELHRND
ncbi:MAG: transcription antitermination factor NusB [Deltaproteobacteria bacterium]|nr:transcription antitermination factor NusB [Deltaproteobacteria bacterium]MBW2529993.1 transcription antitermination factor NusB [Deltaproteobacteria bacterium]